MSVSTQVEAGESGRLRLYTLDTRAHDAAALRDALKGETAEAGPLAAQALGASGVDPFWLTLVPVEDIENIGFSAYLRAGHDVPDAQLVEARAELDAATGTILIVQSPAFAGTPQSLNPAEFLDPLAEFNTIRAPATVRPMQRATVATPRPDSDDTASPRKALPAGAALAVLVAAGLIVVLVSLLGGS